MRSGDGGETGVPELTGGEGESLGSQASVQALHNGDASRPSLGWQTWTKHICAARFMPGAGTQEGVAQRSPPRGG